MRDKGGTELTVKVSAGSDEGALAALQVMDDTMTRGTSEGRLQRL